MRSWQRLRQEAEDAARQQRWRDAVRSYYWATIARFESRGQWTTDRARTPREYLRLVVPGHPRHDDLRLLTRRFESCWYVSDKATEQDCDTARHQASQPRTQPKADESFHHDLSCERSCQRGVLS